MTNLSKQVLVVILDGFGINPLDNKNAIKHAKTPNLDHLFKNYPYAQIEASGTSVGLPKGLPGNSEVGHMNLGAGRSIRQDLVRINESIENKTLKDLQQIQDLIEVARKKTKRIHLIGLLSDGGVHSHIDHLEALAPILTKHKDLNIFYHAFTDGRDTSRDSAKKYLPRVDQLEGIDFASMGGRSFGMDRDRRWNKIELAYKTMHGLGNKTNLSPLEYVNSMYENNIYDEFIEPVLFKEEAKIAEGDCIFFLNFRPDRAIQLSLAFTLPNFNEFKREFIPAHYLCMVPYITDEVPLPILFDKEPVQGGLSQYLAQLDLKQFKIAETEKFAHITFFFNGGQKAPYNNEDRVLVPSPKDVETYDEKPQMSAPEVTKKLVNALKNKDYSFFLVNYANSDMVGHTGNFEAAVKAIESLDSQIKRLVEECELNDIAMIITADHGNSDQMAYEDDSPHTSHTAAKVPFVLFHKDIKNGIQKVETREGDLSLKDLAPSVLNLLGLEIPQNYTGQAIFKMLEK